MKLDDTGLALPPQQVTLDVLLEKYAKGGEKNVEDVRRRVARALAAVEKAPPRWEPVFYAALESGFIPAGASIPPPALSSRRRSSTASFSRSATRYRRQWTAGPASTSR